MSNTQNKTPKLRFPEFENSWNAKNLYEISSKIGDGIHGTPIYDDNGPCFFVNGNNLSFGSIQISASTKKVTEQESLKHSRELNDRTLLMSINGTIGNLAFYKFENVMLGKSVAYINVLPNFNLSYVFYYLSTSKIQLYYHSELTGTTIKNLSLRSIRDTKINFPIEICEQHKIATFLTSIDARIQLLERKKSQLEAYKKGVMQELFSQRLRFKQEDGSDFPEWEEKMLGEVCEKKSSNISANSLTENSGNYKIYGATGFLQYVDFYRETEPYISIVKDGAGVGRILLCDEKSSVLGTLDILKPKEGNDIRFLYAIISNIDFVKYSTGSTIPHIYFKDYSKEKIQIPSLPEQRKIASFLGSLDAQIAAVGAQIGESKEFKRGLLQEMFV
jgi:type I restriction enzyme, S subunit